MRHIEATLSDSHVEVNESHIEEVTIDFYVEANNIGVKEAEEVIKSSLREKCTVANILMRGVRSHPVIKFKKVRKRSHDR